MDTYIALLRGINVSGKNMIQMGPLAAALTVAGLRNVRTYIQSGNIVFESGVHDKAHLTQLIAEVVRIEFGADVPVQVINRAELIRLQDENPFLVQDLKPESGLHLTLLADDPDPLLIARLDKTASQPDEFRIQGRAVYLFCPDGYGRTKLTNTFFEKKLKVMATTRNWKTVQKLCEL